MEKDVYSLDVIGVMMFQCIKVYVAKDSFKELRQTPSSGVD